MASARSPSTLDAGTATYGHERGATVDRVGTAAPGRDSWPATRKATSMTTTAEQLDLPLPAERCRLCGGEVAGDETGRWNGSPAHAAPCVDAAREALRAIAEASNVSHRRRVAALDALRVA